MGKVCRALAIDIELAACESVGVDKKHARVYAQLGNCVNERAVRGRRALTDAKAGNNLNT
jgi:hypothetical protein